LIDHEESEQDSKTKQINAKTISNEGIISLSMVFFLAGHRNIAMTLSYIAYNLAVYPVYQDELLNEITSVLERHVYIF
jgi:cytochrome P450